MTAHVVVGRMKFKKWPALGMSLVCLGLVMVTIGYFHLRSDQPVTSVNIMVLMSDDGRFLKSPPRVSVNGEEAARIGRLFPGAGRWRLRAVYGSGQPRYSLTLTHQNGSTVKVFVGASNAVWHDDYGAHVMAETDGQWLNEIVQQRLREDEEFYGVRELKGVGSLEF